MVFVGEIDGAALLAEADDAKWPPAGRRWTSGTFLKTSTSRESPAEASRPSIFSGTGNPATTAHMLT